MKLSIVTTLYASAPYLREFHRRATVAAAGLIADSFEIIYVNDGSPDDSLLIARELAAGSDYVTVVDLSRNFGHHQAVMAGLEHARGERVFLLDCDLEESPEWLERFWHELEQAPEADVVFGVQARRRGDLFSRLAGGAFWRAFNLLAAIRVPRNAVTVRLMTRRYVTALLSFHETELFLAGVLHAAGFTQRGILVDKANKGRSTYTLRRKLDLLVHAVTSFSAVPLGCIFYAGAAVALAAFAFAGWLVVRKLVYADSISLGWTSVMISIWFLSGVLMMFLGVLGVYLARIFAEVKRRPRAIVREVFRSHGLPREP